MDPQRPGVASTRDGTGTSAALTDLEIAVLRAIAAQHPEIRQPLEVSVPALRVRERWNSGAGVFVHFEPDRSRPPLQAPGRVLGDVMARIDGLVPPMGFLLFLEGGYPDTLEGWSCDPTTAIDFGTVGFLVLNDDRGRPFRPSQRGMP